MGNSLNTTKTIQLLERQTGALERIAEYLEQEKSFAKYLENERIINNSGRIRSYRSDASTIDLENELQPQPQPPQLSQRQRLNSIHSNNSALV